MKVISRTSAKQAGEQLYFTGVPCSKGHIASRYVSSFMCVECMKQWNKSNLKKKAVYNKEWTKRNLAHCREKNKRQYQKNPYKYYLWSRRGYARRKGAGGSFTKAEVDAILRAQRNKCAYCRKVLGEKYHMDHIIAIAKGGRNVAANLQATCPECNHSKHARDPIDFARSKGLLL